MKPLANQRVLRDIRRIITATGHYVSKRLGAGELAGLPYDRTLPKTFRREARDLTTHSASLIEKEKLDPIRVAHQAQIELTETEGIANLAMEMGMEEIARLQDALRIKESKITAAKEEEQRLVAELKATKQWHTQAEQLKADLAKTIREKESAESETRSFVSEIERLERELAHAQQNAEDTKEALITANENADQEAERLSRIIEEKEELIGKHEDTITGLREIIEDTLPKEMEERLKARVAEMEGELDKAQKEEKRLTAELETAKRKKEAAEKRVREVEQRKQQTAKELQKMKSKLQAEIKELKIALGNSIPKTEVEKLNAEIKKKKERIAELERELSEKIAELEAAQTNAREWQTYASHKEEELKQAEVDFKELKKAFKTNIELKSQLGSAVSSLNLQLEAALAAKKKAEEAAGIDAEKPKLAEIEAREKLLQLQLQNLGSAAPTFDDMVRDYAYLIMNQISIQIDKEGGTEEERLDAKRTAFQNLFEIAPHVVGSGYRGVFTTLIGLGKDKKIKMLDQIANFNLTLLTYHPALRAWLLKLMELLSPFLPDRQDALDQTTALIPELLQLNNPKEREEVTSHIWRITSLGALDAAGSAQTLDQIIKINNRLPYLSIEDRKRILLGIGLDHLGQTTRFLGYAPARRDGILHYIAQLDLLSPDNILAFPKLEDQLRLLPQPINPDTRKAVIDHYLEKNLFPKIRKHRTNSDRAVKFAADMVCVEWARRALGLLGQMPAGEQYQAMLAEISKQEYILDDLDIIISTPDDAQLRPTAEIVKQHIEQSPKGFFGKSRRRSAS